MFAKQKCFESPKVQKIPPLAEIGGSLPPSSPSY